jgi:predicted GH43/DUF377 family glycosyl hydrolase
LEKYNDGTYKLFVSDSYLFTTKKRKYSFDICFPMGLFTTKNDSIVLTYGYGDYYNCLVELEEKKIIQLIRHDVEHFNEKEYEYSIIEVDKI